MLKTQDLVPPVHRRALGDKIPPSLTITLCTSPCCTYIDLKLMSSVKSSEVFLLSFIHWQVRYIVGPPSSSLHLQVSVVIISTDEQLDLQSRSFKHYTQSCIAALLKYLIQTTKYLSTG